MSYCKYAGALFVHAASNNTSVFDILQLPPPIFELVPPLAEDYFGNAIVVCEVTMKARELLEEGGFGKGALEMYKMIAMYSNHDKLKNEYESWSTTPSFVDKTSNFNSLVISSFPRFDVYVYGNDFGWGKPVGARS